MGEEDVWDAVYIEEREREGEGEREGELSSHPG